MKRYLLSTFLALLTIVPSFVSSGEELKEEVRRLAKDVPALYLINGLNLTKDQLREILPLLEKAREVKGRAHREMESHLNGSEEALRKLQESLQQSVRAGKVMRVEKEGVAKGTIKEHKVGNFEVRNAYWNFGKETRHDKNGSAQNVYIDRKTGANATHSSLCMEFKLGKPKKSRPWVFCQIASSYGNLATWDGISFYVKGDREQVVAFSIQGKGFRRRDIEIGPEWKKVQIPFNTLRRGIKREEADILAKAKGFALTKDRGNDAPERKGKIWIDEVYYYRVSISECLVDDIKFSTSTINKVERHGKGLHRIKAKQKRELTALAYQVKDLLTASQLEIVKSFVPCFIPASDFRNPSRVGQVVGDTSSLEAVLRRARKLPDRGYHRREERILKRLEEKVKYETAKAVGRKRAYVDAALIRQVVYEARELSDVDFELEKGNLASRLLPNMELEGKRKGDVVRKVETYFFIPDLIPVLRERL